MKIYISGKIAGDPSYQEKFDIAAARLEQLGATVINPATAPAGLTKLDYMRICFAEMEAADHVVFLPDWVSSEGAKLERAWCEYVGVPTADWDAFLAAVIGGKAPGYTFRELLTREHPDAVGTNYASGCMGCPKDYGYEPENKPCPYQHEEWRKSGSLLCAACWDRVVPGSAEMQGGR